MERNVETAVKRMLFIRRALGITQARLSELTGFSLSYIKKVETGARPLTASYLRAVCLALGTSSEYLLSDGPEPPDGVCWGLQDIPEQDLRAVSECVMACLHKMEKAPR